MAGHPALPVLDSSSAYQRNSRSPLRHARRAVQLLTLALWLVLFVLTRDQVTDLVRPDLFLVTDPLVAALTIGASQVIVPTMAYSLIFVAFTLIFGRAFCGWICPLGTLIDGAAKIFRPSETRLSLKQHQSMQNWKYFVLIVMVVGALFSAQWIYLLDPLVLMFRGFTAGVFPMLTGVLPKTWFPGKTGMAYHGVAFLPVFLLAATILLTAIAPRFYCRYLCPLGAFYGLLSRAPLLRRRVSGCDACTGKSGRNATKECITGCRMGAVPSNPHLTQNHECIRCFSGRSFCHTEAIRFDWVPPRPPERKDTTVDLDRRNFVLLGATGAGFAPMVSLSAFHRGEPRTVVRPPRVLDEDVFVDQCIRCAMCVQACPTQTLQLTSLEAGIAGFWTPAITPSVGGCIDDCNACAVACPTDAIPMFDKSETDKWSVKMGTAVLEKNRCISYTEDKKCAECIEICPTKAFVVEPKHDRVPRRPVSVDYFRCIGCGLCEKACRNIVFGTPALLTFTHGQGQPSSLREAPTASFAVPTVMPGPWDPSKE
jgi:polyferredoxin